MIEGGVGSGLADHGWDETMKKGGGHHEVEAPPLYRNVILTRKILGNFVGSKRSTTRFLTHASRASPSGTAGSTAAVSVCPPRCPVSRHAYCPRNARNRRKGARPPLTGYKIPSGWGDRPVSAKFGRRFWPDDRIVGEIRLRGAWAQDAGGTGKFRERHPACIPAAAPCVIFFDYGRPSPRHTATLVQHRTERRRQCASG